MNIFITLQSYPIKTDYSGGWPCVSLQGVFAAEIYRGRIINFIVKTCASYSILAR